MFGAAGREDHRPWPAGHCGGNALGQQHMTGRHQRIYRGHLVVIDVVRRDDDMVNVSITTQSMENGGAGPSVRYTEIFSLDLLGDASRKIRKSLDAWLSDHESDALVSWADC